MGPILPDLKTHFQDSIRCRLLHSLSNRDLQVGPVNERYDARLCAKRGLTETVNGSGAGSAASVDASHAARRHDARHDVTTCSAIKQTKTVPSALILIAIQQKTFSCIHF